MVTIKVEGRVDIKWVAEFVVCHFVLRIPVNVLAEI